MPFSAPSPRELLALPSNKAVLALTCSEARECRSNLRRTLRSPTPRALHRLRVSLRRLRTQLKFYSDFAVDRKKLETLRARLSACADTTNRIRDIHVAETLIRSAKGAALTERRLLMAELRQRRRRAEKQLLPTLRAEIHWFEDALEPQLSKLFPLFVSHPILFGETLRRFEKRSTTGVIRSIRKIRPKHLASKKYSAKVHELRLRAKRLRYLIAPFETISPDVAGKLSALKTLQDRLGTVRDLRLTLRFLARSSAIASPQLEKVVSQQLESALIGAKSTKLAALRKALPLRAIPALRHHIAPPLSTFPLGADYVPHHPSRSSLGEIRACGRGQVTGAPLMSPTRQKRRFPIVSVG
jgi:CHAD domain-containing protein